MPTIIACCFNVLVGIGLPVAILVYFVVKKRVRVLPFMTGAATFFISQMMLRVPILQFLTASVPAVPAFAASQPALFSLLIGLSAGVFEEVGRFVAMRMVKTHRGHKNAVAFGLGHGGIEAFMIMGINYLLITITGSFGLLDEFSAGLVAVSGIERILAITMHVGWSVMVMNAVSRRKPGWLVLAIITHGLVDGLMGILQLNGVGILGVELFIALCAVCLLVYTIVTGKREAAKNAASTPAPVPAYAASPAYAPAPQTADFSSVQPPQSPAPEHDSTEESSNEENS